MRSNADRIVDDWQQLTGAVPLPQPRVSAEVRPEPRIGRRSFVLLALVVITLVAFSVGRTILSSNPANRGLFGGESSPSPALATPTTAISATNSAPPPTASPPSPSPAASPAATPSPIATTEPIGHLTGGNDQLLLMEMTGGGAIGGDFPPDILFALYGNGRAVYRHLVVGVSEGPKQEVRLTEDQVQAVLRFALDNGLPGARTIYPFTTYGPAGSTIFQIDTDTLTRTVEYQLPPGNLMDDTDPEVASLKQLAAGLMAFDPASVGAQAPSPSTSPTAVLPLSAWNDTTVSVVVSINGSAVAMLAPSQELAPIDPAELPDGPWAITLQTSDGFALAQVTMDGQKATTSAFGRSCGQLFAWSGTPKFDRLPGNGHPGDCGPAT